MSGVPVTEWMSFCAETMRITAKRMIEQGLYYPELVEHSAELMCAAEIMQTWIAGIQAAELAAVVREARGQDRALVVSERDDRGVLSGLHDEL